MISDNMCTIQYLGMHNTYMFNNNIFLAVISALLFFKKRIKNVNMWLTRRTQQGPITIPVQFIRKRSKNAYHSLILITRFRSLELVLEVKKKKSNRKSWSIILRTADPLKIATRSVDRKSLISHSAHMYLPARHTY